MQIDFHYYCIGVLAKAAGFNSKDALTIAYASQYVDDSTEGDPIPIKIGNEIVKFDPVLTSYGKVDKSITEAMSWTAQKRVHIPFHFVPPKTFNPKEPTDFSFVTRPGSQFGKMLLEKASKEPLKNRGRRLCRIGVALHTYADSWSHQAFSGRRYPGENNVEAIRVPGKKSDEWHELLFENLLFDVAPQIGHAEAFYFPDLAFQKWRFQLRPSREVLERDNTAEFIQAAENIYNLLKDIDKDYSEQPVLWSQIEPGIRKLLETTGKKPRSIDRMTLPLYRAFQIRDVEQRCNNWRAEFRYLFGERGAQYSYNKLDCRKEIFIGGVEWDKYSQADWAIMQPLEARDSESIWDSSWVHFHRAALRQRHLVLENLP